MLEQGLVQVYTGNGKGAAADLVTEMREVKYYYQQGVQARIGIEK